MWKVLFLKIAVRSYSRFYLPIKKRVEKFWHPSRNKIAFLFSHRYLIHVIMIILMIMVATNNLQAQEVEVAQDYGKKSLLYSLVQQDAGGEIIETLASSGGSRNLFDQTGYVSETTPRLSDEIGNAPVVATEARGAVVKPSIATTTLGEREREEPVKHEVQTGETISTIAEAYGIRTNTVLWENRLGPRDFIKPGQTLTILPTDGVSHQVKKGETLDGIAKKYQADVEKIKEFNELASAEAIQTEQILLIPDGIQPAPTPAPRPRPSIASIGGLFDSTPSPALQDTSSGQFGRPTSGLLINQYFTWRHSGIDISRKSGLEVYASENGRVESVGWQGGYGNTVIINHGGGVKTLYGHLSKFQTSVGESVSRGQAIAMMGSTGWSTGVHLHFEVIVNGRKVNPLSYVK